MNLKRSDVIFYEDTHRYVLGDKELKGITGIISKMLFPDKYSSVPEHILKRAAEKGSYIHAKCQEYDLIGSGLECEEVVNYAKLKKEHGLVTEENEYLVSDNERVATMIDVVFKKNPETVHLADIKTTYSLDVESLSWQLSICARLFEMQNPHISVDKLFGIWLRGDKYKLQEVTRKPDKDVDELLNAYFNKGEYSLVKQETSEIQKLIQVEQFIISLKEEAEMLESKKNDLLSVIEKQMEANDVKKWETENLIITRVLPTTSKTFDTKRFKEENPDLVSKYETETTRKGYLKVKIK